LINAENTHQRTVGKLFLILILLALIYFTTFTELFQVWNSNEDYSHGFFILPISLYLIWRRREEILSQPATPERWGYALMALWVVTYIIGTVGHISTFANVSMIIFVIGAFAILINGRAAHIVLFPAFFMIFMFPIPSEIYARVTNPLMLISTNISFHILSILDVPILKEGNLLFLPNYKMEVVNACSGIRSMLAIMAITLLVGYLYIGSKVIRAVFFLVSVPIALFGNVFRITSTALLAYFYSPQAAEGFSHTFAGIVTFFISFLIICGCIQVVLWYSEKRKPSFSS